MSTFLILYFTKFLLSTRKIGGEQYNLYMEFNHNFSLLIIGDRVLLKLLLQMDLGEKE